MDELRSAGLVEAAEYATEGTGWNSRAHYVAVTEVMRRMEGIRDRTNPYITRADGTRLKLTERLAELFREMEAKDKRNKHECCRLSKMAVGLLKKEIEDVETCIETLRTDARTIENVNTGMVASIRRLLRDQREATRERNREINRDLERNRKAREEADAQVAPRKDIPPPPPATRRPTFTTPAGQSLQHGARAATAASDNGMAERMAALSVMPSPPGRPPVGSRSWRDVATQGDTGTTRAGGGNVSPHPSTRDGRRPTSR